MPLKRLFNEKFASKIFIYRNARGKCAALTGILKKVFYRWIYLWCQHSVFVNPTG